MGDVRESVKALLAEVAGRVVPWSWVKDSGRERIAKFRVTEEDGVATNYTVYFMLRDGALVGVDGDIWTMVFFYGSDDEFRQALLHNWQDRPGDTKKAGTVFGTVGDIVKNFIMSGTAEGVYVVPGSEALARIYKVMVRRMGGTSRELPELGALYLGR